jgi:hypothetical protein
MESIKMKFLLFFAATGLYIIGFSLARPDLMLLATGMLALNVMSKKTGEKHGKL